MVFKNEKDYGYCEIVFPNDIKNDIKERILKIFDDEYLNNDTNYIKKIDSKHFEGDMGCLSVLGSGIYQKLCENKLNSYLDKFEIFYPYTNFKEDFVKGFDDE